MCKYLQLSIFINFLHIKKMTCNRRDKDENNDNGPGQSKTIGQMLGHYLRDNFQTNPAKSCTVFQVSNVQFNEIKI